MANSQDDSAERVAFDLMKEIANHEEVRVSREYFLKLYRQCLKATLRKDLKSILQDD